MVAAMPWNFHERDRHRRWLYVMRCHDDYVKVGLASDVHRRREEVQTYNPVPVEVVFRRAVPDTVAIFAEKHAHAALAEYRIHGEWFKVSVQVAAKAVVAAIKAAGPRADALRDHANMVMADKARYQRDATRKSEAIAEHHESLKDLDLKEIA